jgi:hypothetical protein
VSAMDGVETAAKKPDVHFRFAEPILRCALPR